MPERDEEMEQTAEEGESRPHDDPHSLEGPFGKLPKHFEIGCEPDERDSKAEEASKISRRKFLGITAIVSGALAFGLMPQSAAAIAPCLTNNCDGSSENNCISPKGNICLGNSCTGGAENKCRFINTCYFGTGNDCSGGSSNLCQGQNSCTGNGSNTCDSESINSCGLYHSNTCKADASNHCSDDSLNNCVQPAGTNKCEGSPGNQCEGGAQNNCSASGKNFCQGEGSNICVGPGTENLCHSAQYHECLTAEAGNRCQADAEHGVVYPRPS
jgi:hypothetical protein